MNLDWIDNGIALVKDLGLGLINLIGKSKLDVTEKEKMVTEIQLKGMDFQIKMMEFKTTVQMKWMELTATAKWRSVIIYGSGALIGIMMVNNYVLLPYFPALKPTPIPWELWAIFGGLTGVDMGVSAYNKQKSAGNPPAK